jgi:hypothetical protein
MAEADYEELVKSHVRQMSGSAGTWINLNDRLELHLDPLDQRQLLVIVGDSVPVGRPRDFEAENEIVVDPAASLADVVHYASYLAGDPSYPRPRPGK